MIIFIMENLFVLIFLIKGKWKDNTRQLLGQCSCPRAGRPSYIVEEHSNCPVALDPCPSHVPGGSPHSREAALPICFLSLWTISLGCL